MVTTPPDGSGRVTELACETPIVEGATIQLPYTARADGVAVRTFTELIELPGSLDQVPAQTLDPVLRLLSLAASLSYFKAYAPADITVPGGLTASDQGFIEALTHNGMGEFAYVNNLPEVFATQITGPVLDDVPLDSQAPEPKKLLVAVGGGKDSIVSIEALTGAGYDIGLFSVNGYEPIERTAEVADIALRSARRTIDPQLFELNAAGAPNGHVPVTALNSLVAVATALALGYDTVVFSNEASSSYGNVDWQGHTINHQWSKGSDFERVLRQSLPAGAPGYLSLLRPITELRIARRFAHHTDYHHEFTSCNRAFKLREADRTTWCADCPKCRFVFLCLAPFLSRSALVDIFGGRDMFADETQFEGFLDLLGLDDRLKPFECVGEPDECRVALGLLAEHPDWKDHAFLARDEIANAVGSAPDRDAVFTFDESEHFLPESLAAVVREL